MANLAAINPTAPSQLAGLTVGALSNILSTFSGKTVALWDIEEASYISNATRQANPNALPAVFHVFQTQQPFKAGLAQVSDNYGRRKVKYMFPYKDGQASDDLGKKPADYAFDVIIHGPNYLSGLQNLVNELSQPTPGVLTHPVFGDIDVIVEDYTMAHSSEERLAVHLQLKFSENSFTIQDAFDIAAGPAGGKSSFQSAIANVLSAFANFQTAVNAVTAKLQAISTLRQQIIQSINDFQSYYAQVAGQINAAFSSDPTQIASLFPVNLGGILNSDGTVVNPPITGGLSPNDPFANVPVSELSAAAQTAIAQIQVQNALQGAWTQGAALIKSMEATLNGQGALAFHDNVLDIKNSLLFLENAITAGLAQSNFKVFLYTLPWDMSAREVCFRNNISLDNVDEIGILNPNLDSTNQIPMGTVLTVAV
jgi:hypothetical protein